MQAGAGAAVAVRRLAEVTAERAGAEVVGANKLLLIAINLVRKRGTVAFLLKYCL
jgi:hypothetical protein